MPRAHRKYVTDPSTIKELDGLEADLARAKQQYATRQSDINAVRTRAGTIAHGYEEDAAAPTGAEAPSGLYKDLGVPWAKIQEQLRAGAAVCREIVADIDAWLASGAGRSP